MALLDAPDKRNVADSTGIETTAPDNAVPSDTEEEDEDTTVTEGIDTIIEVEPVDVTEIEPTVVIYPELKYMEIAAIVAKEGENAKVNTELGEDEENSVPVTISFYATEEQARRLAELEMNNTIYIAFVARGEDALAFISESEKVLLKESE